MPRDPLNTISQDCDAQERLELQELSADPQAAIQREMKRGHSPRMAAQVVQRRTKLLAVKFGQPKKP